MGMLTEVVDRVCAKMALRLIDVAIEKGMVPPNSSIGVHRAGGDLGEEA